MCAHPNMHDSAEVKENAWNLLLESPDKVRVLQSIMAVHLGHDACSFSWLLPLSK